MADYDYEMYAEGEDPDFAYDMSPYDDDWSQQDEQSASSLPPMTALQLFEHCMLPTLSDGAKHLGKTLAYCLIYRLTTQTVRVPSSICHAISVGCGLMVAYHFFGQNISYLLAQGFLAYTVLCLAHYAVKKYRGFITMFVCLAFIILCELVLVEPIPWHSIRAAQMLIAMRAISVGFDTDDKQIETLPRPMPFFGYLFCVGTAVFGPWVPIKDYLNLQSDANRVWNIRWAIKLIFSVIVSLFFLTVSACWTIWLIPETSPTWFGAYRDALSFRSSHYFVSYMSEATAIAIGLGLSQPMTVSRPISIEWPRSLVEVVVNWNLPMHFWLRNYVFRVCKAAYGNFLAICATYGVSALLHGINFQIAAVLFSLGLYSYTEHITRVKLANIFDACILARSCKTQGSCRHAYKADRFFVRLTNICFTFVAIFHLAYLGLMFDSTPNLQEEGYSWIHTLGKWRALGFASHWLAFVTYIFYILI